MFIEIVGTNYDPGIGIEAAKVVSDCIHSSRVKEMGLYLLKKNTNVEEEEDGDVLQSFDRLGEDEVKKFQLKLARSLIVYMELLHLLIARNRDLLLDVIQERKKGGGDSGPQHSYSRSLTRGEFSVVTANSDTRSIRSYPRQETGAHDSVSSQEGRSRESSTVRSHRRTKSGASTNGEDHPGVVAPMPTSSTGSERVRTDSAIGIQSELQRAFISLAKDLHPMILGIMGAETPRWLKQCCQDNYFSAYTYRQVKIRKYRHAFHFHYDHFRPNQIYVYLSFSSLLQLWVKNLRSRISMQQPTWPEIEVRLVRQQCLLNRKPRWTLRVCYQSQIHLDHMVRVLLVLLVVVSEAVQQFHEDQKQPDLSSHYGHLNRRIDTLVS